MIDEIIAHIHGDVKNTYEYKVGYSDALNDLLKSVRRESLYQVVSIRAIERVVEELKEKR